MDDSVGGQHVRHGDRCVVDLNATLAGEDGHVLALNGGRGRQSDHVGGGHAAGYDVIREHRAQRLGIGKQPFERAGGQLGERLVSGCEDGERAGALERVDQAGGVEGGRQRGERAGRDGGVDDVYGLDHRGRACLG